MSVTIKDIAKRANVSHTTVSRALNDSPLINQETKDRIKALAEQMNYTPNFSAKSLVLDRSYNVGLFFSTLETGTSAGFFHDTVRGVNSVIKDEYNLVVKGIDDYAGGFPRITRKSFDGIILMSQSEQDDAFIRYVTGIGIPLVVLNRELVGVKAANILSDERKGAFRMTEYLIAMGHTRIAVLEGKAGFRSSQERLNGVKDALQANGLPFTPSYSVKGAYTMESGYKAMKKLLKAEPLPTAVFCFNDDMAVGAIRAIEEHGLRVPKDISVSGFDDNLFSGYLFPALTTVKRPIESISREGASMLLRLMGRQEMPDDPVFMHTELVERESVRRIEQGE
ncbi:LacI family DNA-binding transcriptional regulator [Paenibacillus aurantius]|uniref:LacI family DNA-binding transcriptional regulator n=1 Tax=Paenibacillus aurantius TaxID=2918900 RepID=A0AA96LGU8_9BACL|nr:LacI family DNA-binding transcriptional regulator [Paenibacillus aurantius]WNQ13611.1 LacI family DNA-binding transcriptional regulator [Paenibacillus aurantius]